MESLSGGNNSNSADEYYDGLESDPVNEDYEEDYSEEEGYDEYDDEYAEDNSDELDEGDDADTDSEDDSGSVEDDEEREEETEGDDEPVEESRFPEYVPEDLIPKEFTSAREELEFYRNNYTKMAELPKSEEYINFLMEGYRDTLLKETENVEEVKALYKAVKGGDPVAFIKMYFPEELAQQGKDPRIAKHEAYSIVDQKMSEEFGKDWKDHFNIDDALDPKTESGKMAMSQREYLAEVQQANKRAEAELVKYRPPTQEAIQEVVSRQYKELFEPSGFKKEDYDSFIEDIKDWKYTLADLHKARYFDGYIEIAEKEAFEKGKKAAAKQIASSQGRKSSPEARRVSRPREPESVIKTQFDIYNRNHF